MIIKFQEERQALRTVSSRPSLAKYLFELSQMVASGTLVKAPYAIVVTLLNADEPEVVWEGAPSVQDLEDAMYSIRDKIEEIRFKVKKPKSTVKQMRESRERMTLEKMRYEDAHPWVCEHFGCKKRFKSERGAKQHEASCWRRMGQST